MLPRSSTCTSSPANVGGGGICAHVVPDESALLIGALRGLRVPLFRLPSCNAAGTESPGADYGKKKKKKIFPK